MKLRTFQPGDPIGPFKKPPVTRTQLVMYAGASGDFNPIHYDDDYARKSGLGGVIAHGMLTMAFVGQMLTDLIGTDGDLRTFGVRFTGMVRPGDEITCEGRVKETRWEEGKQVVCCDIWASTQNGDRVVTGKAEFSVPAA
ncbi:MULTISPECIES: MaoC family dehydratase [Thermoactinomyces]|jgi:acyl dehydratase|uniref:MaoC family dehydratase n=1 Tax=Thermoactinomyces vulgaris TaxID=2026 RepID=A0ABS0QEH9_THEVU|nr:MULTISPECIES: MaoC family dehydratase [Thermoactinomyces]KFZ41260.1 dehydratase [Thermoactinomyces sp. Gus2-1]KYQ87559.1 dehydratase [Thermoactinomyces sp. AS95]MBA4551266.1 MaoC family dehydratase [Thermoactinomyces vulgaris]MBA4595523.1 MaoC family dehydratase [Thermoactinomyces vulgaris]MBH8587692.1 MaoC family dehydratase [Thermoactinomyces vulgaris]